MTQTVKKQIHIADGAILAIQLGDIGDVVLTLPSLHALQRSFPHNTLVACVREKAGELMKICTDVDAVISVDKRTRPLGEEIRYQLDFLSRLRQHQFDLSIDFRTGTRGAIISRLCGARQRLGFFDPEEKLWRNRMFSHLVHIEYQLGTHVADYYFKLIESMGIKPHGLDPVLPVPERLIGDAIDLLARRGVDGTRPFIVLQPFSLWRYKELHADKYVDLLHRLSERCKAPVIVSGGPNEEQRVEELIHGCHDQVINMAGETTIGQLAGLLAKADLFIGVDSAGLHIAAATGTPTISIFGPSAPSSWAPRGNRHLVIQPLLPCVPCREKGCDNSGISCCLDGLSVDEIMDAIDSTLNRLFRARTQE